tara:strand:- start:2117 stop:2617 length:501 start_codon:yes stop_codon:yes gene_type:complete
MFKSKTLYNVKIIPEFDSRISEDVELKSLEQLKEEGLFGYKQVDERGRVFSDFDSKCDVNYVGRFDLGGKRSAFLVSQEVNLASGSQSPEVYVDKGIDVLRYLVGRVDFWKEQETGNWYDYSVMENRLMSLAWSPKGLKQWFKRGDRENILMDLLQNPDNVERVTW